MKKNQKKLAKARSAKPGKARRATPALSPSLSPSTAAARPSSPPPDLPFAPGPRGGDTLSIEAMLRAQLEATHLAAMDCLHRATTAESPELRDRALTHATRLLALFTRQVNVLGAAGRRRRRPGRKARWRAGRTPPNRGWRTPPQRRWRTLRRRSRRTTRPASPPSHAAMAGPRRGKTVPGAGAVREAGRLAA